jgi:hypothetical protein
LRNHPLEGKINSNIAALAEAARKLAADRAEAKVASTR